MVWRIRIPKQKLDLVPKSCKFAVNQVVWRIRVPKLNLDLVPKSCKFAVNQLVWRIRAPKLNLDLVLKSCKYTANQVAWRIRFPKLHLDLVRKSCKNNQNQNQVVWRIRIRNVRFPKFILHRGLEAFVDICIHVFHPFFKDQDPKIESRFSPKIMQIRCKPARLEDKDPKTESGFSPKIMQICCKPGGLEDKGPKTEFDLVPKSCKNTQNQVVWRVRIRKVRFPKLILHRGLEAFVDICIHLFYPFFEGSGSENWI